MRRAQLIDQLGQRADNRFGPINQVLYPRLSHLVKRLESRGYVRREADPAAGRFTNAILLPAGLSKLESSAPSHVAYVRQLVIDNLSPERLRRLGQDADRIVGRIDSPAR